MRTCWQIRKELAEGTGNGSKPNGWLVDCVECVVNGNEMSCWEQCSGSPCCCAPIHVTCDFCILYIEHRREIAEWLHADGIPPAAILGAPARPSTHEKGEGSATMEKLQLNVPNLWADHHVLKVRALLTALPGVQDVISSSAFRMVMVSYDPALITPGAIMAELEEGGYPVATDGGVIAETVPIADGKRDPAWTRLGMRQIKTDERDLKTKR